jgi:sugar phosphate isomerase/epimerase
MSRPISRRNLIGVTATAVATVAMGGTAMAIEPIKRPGNARLRLSLAAYSYRDYLQGKAEPHMTYEEFVDRAATYPIDAVELTEYYWPKPIKNDYLMKIKRQCYLAGLDISGSPMANVFTHPAGAARDAEIAKVKEWVDWCALLGVPAIRIFAGNAQKEQSLADAKRFAVESIEASCEYAGQKGVILALENHGGIVAEAKDILDIVKAVKSPWFGINLDTGNFHTDDPYGDLAKCAPYAVTCQVKTEIQPRGKPKQDADLKREIQILKDAGYRGYVTLEYEAAETPLKAVPRILDQMAALL